MINLQNTVVLTIGECVNTTVFCATDTKQVQHKLHDITEWG